jgi:hypothetical protein
MKREHFGMCRVNDSVGYPTMEGAIDALDKFQPLFPYSLRDVGAQLSDTTPWEYDWRFFTDVSDAIYAIDFAIYESAH